MPALAQHPETIIKPEQQSSPPVDPSQLTHDTAPEQDHDSALLTLYASLSGQATRLLDELTLFQNYIAAHSSDKDVFLARFGREVRREADVLDRYGHLVEQYRSQVQQNSNGRQVDQQIHQREHDLNDEQLQKHALNDGHNEKHDVGYERETQEDVNGQTEHDDVYGDGDDKHDDESDDENANEAKEVKASNIPGLHNIRSSNITSYVAVWEEAKRNEGVVGLKKKVKYSINGIKSKSAVCGGDDTMKTSSTDSTWSGVQTGAMRTSIGRKPRRNGRETVMVDVAADHGRKWVKVWTKSQAWLEMDMAKEGLVDLDQDEDGHVLDRIDDSEGRVDISHLTQRDLEALQDLKLVKMASEFVAAAKTTRVDHRHPKVHFVLPKIYRGGSRDVDIVLAVIERMGIVVSCSGEQDEHDPYSSWTLMDHFDRMLIEPVPLPRPNEGLLNLDCTVLIALISDISHFELKSDAVPNGVEIPTHYHGQTRCDIVDQFLSDQQRPLLTSDVYPVLSGKRLRCTCVAANHLKKIVRLMGTETEVKRSQILLGNLEQNQARTEWNKLTIRPIGEFVTLPVEVVEFDRAQALSDIWQQGRANVNDVDFEVAQRISSLATRQLSDLNKAVFIYGWSSCITTFTLNRVVSGYIHRAIDDFLDEVEAQRKSDKDRDNIIFRGPRMEICARERSLIGSEKTCRNK